jgi:hypothetical protein
MPYALNRSVCLFSRRTQKHTEVLLWDDAHLLNGVVGLPSAPRNLTRSPTGVLGSEKKYNEGIEAPKKRGAIGAMLWQLQARRRHRKSCRPPKFSKSC